MTDGLISYIVMKVDIDVYMKKILNNEKITNEDKIIVSLSDYSIDHIMSIFSELIYTNISFNQLKEFMELFNCEDTCMTSFEENVFKIFKGDDLRKYLELCKKYAHETGITYFILRHCKDTALLYEVMHDEIHDYIIEYKSVPNTCYNNEIEYFFNEFKDAYSYLIKNDFYSLVKNIFNLGIERDAFANIFCDDLIAIGLTDIANTVIKLNEKIPLASETYPIYKFLDICNSVINKKMMDVYTYDI